MRENVTIFAEKFDNFCNKSDGLYKSVHQSKKNIIFDHISMLSPYLHGRSYFLIFIKKKNEENIDYNR